MGRVPDGACRPSTCVYESAWDRSAPAEGPFVTDVDGNVILEPVQGEGGYRIPSEAFAREVADLCERRDVTLIVDEIQTGLGRTGEWWRRTTSRSTPT